MTPADKQDLKFIFTDPDLKDHYLTFVQMYADFAKQGCALSVLTENGERERVHAVIALRSLVLLITMHDRDLIRKVDAWHHHRPTNSYDIKGIIRLFALNVLSPKPVVPK